jgi:mRNA-degrading endonuclease RelE of RelBE toxin-antitoxin system
MKPVKVVLSPEAEEAYKQLNSIAVNSKLERSILNSIKKKVALIKMNPHYGNPMAKKLIPKEYVLKYGVTNLFRVELSGFWRMLYTLTNDETEVIIVAFVLDIIDHREYDRKFGYKS